MRFRARFASYIGHHHVALIALFIALGGVAYAAVQLPRNSVGSKQLRARAVKRSDIAADAVNSGKVANGSLRAGDFASGQLPQGPTGPTGLAGQDATNLFAFVSDNGAATVATLAYGQGAVSVQDPAGENQLGAPYVVTFNRSLVGCVAQATVGNGASSDGGYQAGPMTLDISGNGVNAFSVSESTGTTRDTSFMLSVFC